MQRGLLGHCVCSMAVLRLNISIRDFQKGSLAGYIQRLCDQRCGCWWISGRFPDVYPNCSWWPGLESVLIDHFIGGWLGCGNNLTINDCGLGFERRSWRFTEKNSMPIKCNQSKYKKAMKTISLQKITSNNHYLIHNSTQVQQIGYSHQRRRLPESSFQFYRLLNCKPFQSLTSITCSPPHE